VLQWIAFRTLNLALAAIWLAVASYGQAIAPVTTVDHEILAWERRSEAERDTRSADPKPKSLDRQILQETVSKKL
jgi:hypothetical protein